MKVDVDVLKPGTVIYHVSEAGDVENYLIYGVTKIDTPRILVESGFIHVIKFPLIEFSPDMMLKLKVSDVVDNDRFFVGMLSDNVSAIPQTITPINYETNKNRMLDEIEKSVLTHPFFLEDKRKVIGNDENKDLQFWPLSLTEWADGIILKLIHDNDLDTLDITLKDIADNIMINRICPMVIVIKDDPKKRDFSLLRYHVSGVVLENGLPLSPERRAEYNELVVGTPMTYQRAASMLTEKSLVNLIYNDTYQVYRTLQGIYY